jgi:hypothetical protein
MFSTLDDRRFAHRPGSFLAFVHIEKAAGTTFIHILRRNFLFRYLDVRPLSQSSGGIFLAKDLRVSLKVNPFIVAFGGHSVRPVGDLCDAFPGTRFVTILRDPIRRYISQFLYGNAVLNLNNTFERFLADENTHDFQTRKIAGSPSVATAKALLEKNFLAVGIVELFDIFLAELAARLRPFQFDTWHEARNVGGYAHAEAELLSRFEGAIRAVNQSDIELYEHVREKYCAGSVEIEATQRGPSSSRPKRLAKSYLDGALRKLYYEPVTGAIRMAGGLPMKGSY